MANGLCEQCKAKGIIKPDKEVDHIIELTDKNKHDWNIAMHHGTTVRRLLSLNPDISNPDLIYPGQRINVGTCKCW